MLRRSHIQLSTALCVAVFAAACGHDSVTAPSTSQMAAPSSPSQTKGVVVVTKVKALMRNRPLQGDITVTKTIGMFGGVIALPNAGMTLIVPFSAVDKPTTFTVTARAGKPVRYDFAPHGITFKVPLLMQQDVRNIEGGNSVLGTLQLGYYPEAGNPFSVTELTSASVDLARLLGIVSIWHFSGYIFATARDEQ